MKNVVEKHIFKIIFILLFLNHVNGCGIVTHTEIGHRASSHYEYLFSKQNISISKLIKNHEAAFQAGNPYPDSFYPSICKKGHLSSVSEDTHWVPFLNATINYFRKTYNGPTYSEKALNLLAFTLGFVSHQMADVTWHSLGIDQGFLSAMGFINFHGSFSDAHSVGDFGGDILVEFELNMKFISDLTEWHVPYDDLYQIYLQLYGTEKITKEDIIECSR
jgi:glycosylphosphatidylinositol phospholipase D